MPEPGYRIWEIWHTLSRHRQTDMGQPLPISLTDLWSFRELYGLKLTEWDIRTIGQMDDMYVRERISLDSFIHDLKNPKTDK